MSRPRTRGDRRAGEPLRGQGVCCICGRPYRNHPIFGDCYQQAMIGQHNRGKTGAETVTAPIAS